MNEKRNGNSVNYRWVFRHPCSVFTSTITLLWNQLSVPFVLAVLKSNERPKFFLVNKLQLRSWLLPTVASMNKSNI